MDWPKLAAPAPVIDFGVPKEDWGDGPWQHEPDDSGLFQRWEMWCRCLRGPMGSWCGYVLVPIADFLRWFDARDTHYGRFWDEPDGRWLNVHGDVTWAKPGVIWMAEDDEDWATIGFDMGHAFDYSPALEARTREMYARLPSEEQAKHAGMEELLEQSAVALEAMGKWGMRDIYRRLEHCMAETEHLAYQLRFFDRPPLFTRHTLGSREAKRDRRLHPPSVPHG